MSNNYAPIHAFLDAAAREFNDIADALARASCASPIIDAGAAGKGALLPIQVTACFRTVELDNLFGPAVQCAAASPLKHPLKQLVEKMRHLQLTLRQKAIKAEDADGTPPGDFVEKYCQAVAELRSYIGTSAADPAGAAAAERTEQDTPDRRDDNEGKGDESDCWLTVSEAARIAGCNNGTISRAVNAAKLNSNEKIRRDRRIDAADLSRWQLDRAKTPEPAESNERVERSVKKHVRD